MMEQFQLIVELYPAYFNTIQEAMQDIYLDPPTLMDSNWKLVVFMHSLLSQWTSEEENIIFNLTQEVMC